MSEIRPDYDNYTFAYAVYCLKESQKELPDIYNRGFLPYTADLRLENEVFYLARSLRINLENFEDSSENRRIHRKAATLGIELQMYDKSDLARFPGFFSFALQYSRERIGPRFSEERLRYIMSRDTATHFFYFSKENIPIAFIIVCRQDPILHYWFAFYETKYLLSHSIGKWLMWRTIRWAKDEGLKYVYLGTCYGEKSLYKARDYRGIEFFSGNQWESSLETLKSLCKTDSSGKLDRFKLFEDPNLFLEKLC